MYSPHGRKSSSFQCVCLSGKVCFSLHTRNGRNTDAKFSVLKDLLSSLPKLKVLNLLLSDEETYYLAKKDAEFSDLSSSCQTTNIEKPL